MNIMSLFGGMECGRMAVDDVKIDNYYSSEVNKHAIDVVSDNFPCVIHLGDITNWREWEVDWASIDLLIGGSPCQGFSRVGQALNFDDPRSKLFFVFVEILNHIKSLSPNVNFMLENVDMKKEWIDVISDHLGVSPILVDAKYFTAHSRPRLFWFDWAFNDDLPEEKTLSSVFGYEVKGCSRRARYINGKDGKTFQKLEVRKDDLANCMTTVAKNCKVIIDNTERNLTVDEGCLLQDVPLNYFNNASKSQALKMLGNGWNVGVIKHIFSTCPKINYI